MQYGICLLSVVPCRKEPDSTSEMVTQLLFGESYTVLEVSGNWINIITAFDNYECWINIMQHTKITETAFKRLEKEDAAYSSELIQVISNKLTKADFPITIGGRLPFLKDKKVSFDNFEYFFDGQSTLASKKRLSSDIISSAFLLLNAPYLWGGKSPFGIDCSGFTQVIYKINGYKLPRDAAQQVEIGSALNFVEEAEAGDLAFFDNEEGKIIHVGILLDNERIIHASGCVRIDRFDHYGIHNSDTKKYSHTLRVIKRVL